MTKKQPNTKWTFRCGHTGQLPKSFGETNKFVLWVKSKYHSAGGEWTCRRCHNKRNRKYKRKPVVGDLARIKSRLQAANCVAKAKNYEPPKITPERAIGLWALQNGCCAACGTGISLEKSKFGSNLDHDHESGEVRGFVCHNCNLAEGLLKNYSGQRFDSFCAYRQKWVVNLPAFL